MLIALAATLLTAAALFAWLAYHSPEMPAQRSGLDRRAEQERERRHAEQLRGLLSEYVARPGA